MVGLNSGLAARLRKAGITPGQQTAPTYINTSPAARKQAVDPKQASKLSVAKGDPAEFARTQGFTPTQGLGQSTSKDIERGSNIRAQVSTNTKAAPNKVAAQRAAFSSKAQEIGGGGSAATSLLKQSLAKKEALKAAQMIQNEGLAGEWEGGTGDVDMTKVNLPNYGQDQLSVAQTIYNVGKAKGASNRDIQIALMTAFQESGMRNISHGDRDSVGVFQQRTSQGWGSVQQIMDPTYSAGKFFDGLLGLGDKRNSMALTQAAQAVQRSAFPDAYAKHEGKASQILNAFISASGGKPSGNAAATNKNPNPTGKAAEQGFKAPTTVRQRLLDEAFGMLGIPYAWGGGGIGNRSSRGTGKGTTNVIGVDCSGLTSYVYGTIGVKLPRHSTAQYSKGVKTAVKNAKPGDLIGKPGGGHVGIYIGNGKMLHSPRPGQKVQIRNVASNEFAVSLTLPGD